MNVLLQNWLPVALTAVLELAFALTMFVPAYGVAAAIMSARRRQLEREARRSEHVHPLYSEPRVARDLRIATAATRP